MAVGCPDGPKGKHSYNVDREVKKNGTTYQFMSCVFCGKKIMDIIKKRAK
jgi:hypothetical protein